MPPSGSQHTVKEMVPLGGGTGLPMCWAESLGVNQRTLGVLTSGHVLGGEPGQA